MTLTAVVLILISACTHAGWNFLGKRGKPCIAFFAIANTVGGLMLTPVLIARPGVLSFISPRIWMLLIATGLFQAIYYVGLAGAYRKGDMSLAYPLARSSPVLIVAGISILMGRGEQLSVLSMVGMGLIAMGGLLLPLTRFSNWHPRNYLQVTALLALVAAIGTSGYSTVDDAALRTLRDAAAPSFGRTTVTLVYAVFEAFSASAWLAAFLVFEKGGYSTLKSLLRERAGSMVLTGVGIYTTYALVLIAMGYVRNVSYVVAFRQLSIPLGTLLGVTVLGEPRPAPKLTGVALMVAGLVLVGIG